MTTTNPRRPSVPYIIEWRWRDDSDGLAKVDHYTATDALAAVAKLKKALSEEYADVSGNIVILAVYRD